MIKEFEEDQGHLKEKKVKIELMKVHPKHFLNRKTPKAKFKKQLYKYKRKKRAKKKLKENPYKKCSQLSYEDKTLRRSKSKLT